MTAQPKPRTVAPKVDNPLVAALLRTPGADAPDLAPKAKRQRKPNLKRKLSKDPSAPKKQFRGGGIQPVLQNIVLAACKQLPDRFQFSHVMQVIPHEHFRAVQVILTKLTKRGYLDRQKVERIERNPLRSSHAKSPTMRRRVYSYTLTEKGRTTDAIPVLHQSVRNLQRPDGGGVSEDAVPACGVGGAVHQPAGGGGEGNAS